MKAAETLIAWNGAGQSSVHGGPPGGIGIGPLLFEGDGDWTVPYDCTGGAAMVDRRHIKGAVQQAAVMRDWYELVYSYGIHPYVAHRAFLLIDEYQAVIKAWGMGPAKDEPGHDPTVGFGRSIRWRKPPLCIKQWGKGTHFWLRRSVKAVKSALAA
jgi:hypothetical protein